MSDTRVLRSGPRKSKNARSVCWVRGRENVPKRNLVHFAGHNSGMLMRLLIGAGTPREAVARGLSGLMLIWWWEQSAVAANLLIDKRAKDIAATIVILSDAF